MSRNQNTTRHSQSPPRHSRAGGNPVNNANKPNINSLIIDNLDTWTTAIKSKSRTGRGTNKTYELYGVKKLRELILDLAVRGLLVPQDPRDEPASVLLEKIAFEKEQLIKERKIKKQKALPEITEEEKPFDLPDNWEWSRLNLVSKLENGDRSKNYPNKSLLVESGLPFVNAGHLQDGRINNDKMTFITKNRFDMLRAGKFVNGDILFCLRGSLGKSAIVEGFETGAIASSLVIVRLLSKLNSYYIHNFFNSPLSYQLIKKYDNGTAQPNLSASDLGKFLVPIPPIIEQKRIVAKVDELMTLCDQLEGQTDTSIQAHKLLVENLLNALTQAKDHKTFQQAWQRIAKHFDILFITEHSIDQLKQTILQLAVMGKLVPQNPNDEPASELLKKITKEKEKLINQGKIKKQKPLPEISEEEKPFDIPKSWEWCRLQKLVTLLGDGLHGTPSYDDRGDYYFINGNNLSDGVIEIKPETKRVDEVTYLKYKKNLNLRTVLVSINGTLGNVAFYNNEPVMLGKSACYFNLGFKLSKLFFKRLIESDYFLGYAYKYATGSTIKNLGLKTMNNFQVALPPLEEQHLIVKKVDKLMDICDQLKSQITKSKKIQTKIANTLTHL